MKLGYGFNSGKNRINKKRIQYWRHSSEDIDMRAFVWFITQYFQVRDYSVDWVDVEIWNVGQRERFYSCVKEYDNEMWYHNYLEDKDNDLVQTHHRGYDTNKEVLERLVEEKC